ncbi:hypothetical protein [Streptomyces uncialis]|uniref:hypothetical protein n=1 Tax=Streptomyces uncialis TaxID=1048205 RepID=UPI0015C0B1BF|nr:hypothetical protein [Streptomyces uncialis]
MLVRLCGRRVAVDLRVWVLDTCLGSLPPVGEVDLSALVGSDNRLALIEDFLEPNLFLRRENPGPGAGPSVGVLAVAEPASAKSAVATAAAVTVDREKRMPIAM